MSTSAAHTQFYRLLFAELGALVRRWSSLDSESSSHFATLANIGGRISLLQENSKDLGVLATFENLPEQMTAIQFAGLEAVMQTLRTAFGILESIVIDMECLNIRSKEYYAKNSIACDELLRVRPTAASIAQSIEWIEYIASCHRKELLEKRNILEKVKYDSSEGLSFLYEQWTRSIHLDNAVIGDYVTRGKEYELD